MIKIAPSILSADFSRLGEEIKMLNESGADMVHIDIMDGHFVPNLTIGPLVIEKLRELSDLPFDVHLMMDNPMDFIDDFVDAGANIISIHAEAVHHLHRSIIAIKEKGVKASVTLNPSTPLNVLDYVIEDLDMVLLMTVNPGFGGQSYIPSMTRKIKDLRAMANKFKPDLDIEVDGGINIENIGEVVKAGANVIVSGSSIFMAKEPKKMIEKLRNLAIV